MSWLSIKILIYVVLTYAHCYTCLSSKIPEGFVNVNDIIPGIQISLRYISNENFMGHNVNGYLSNVLVLTRSTAFQLKQAQLLAKSKGYELVIYDGYRPQKGVNQFMSWARNSNDSDIRKSYYYPRVNKLDTFKLGYIADKSGHTRGSTIDLTLILLGKYVQIPLKVIERTLTDNFKILYLDDGTVDMGSSFDLFDEASQTNSTLVDESYLEKRLMLRNIMELAGFINYDKEWWHYTLKNEPFPDTYFDFDITLSCSCNNPKDVALSKFFILGNFSNAWQQFMHDPHVVHALYSMTIIDGRSGSILFEHAKDIGLLPASSLKTITAAASLHYLGADYTYETLLKCSGELDTLTGFLDGYIYIVGSGDPSLGSSRYDEMISSEFIIKKWVKAIREFGIQKCRGIIGDTSVWNNTKTMLIDGWSWNDIG